MLKAPSSAPTSYFDFMRLDAIVDEPVRATRF